MKHKKIFFILLALASVFILGVFFDRLFLSASLSRSSGANINELRQSFFSSASTTYSFIDPLLGCDVEKKDIAEFNGLKQNILNVINDRIANKQLVSASVYFDTRDGRWLGINLNEKYFPASLMKVPLMIAVLKVAESHPELLRKKVLYDGSFDLNKIEYFKPAKILEPHHSYTVDELLERMAGYSDNNAVPLLVNVIDPNILNEVFSDLGINTTQNDVVSLGDYLTVKQYANFFRVLYNASYLNRDMSEKALGLLSLPDFPDGMMAGLPPRTKFSDKFGERNFSNDPRDSTSQKELHDCGIIYAPNHPYLLCVMTKGMNLQDLADTIKDVAKVTYDNIAK